jgi:carbonic anhydrase/acetyltransferase-like protein (isoleucine patch superfamily)
MALYSLSDYKPVLGEGVYISESADVIGRVFIGNHSSIWFNSVVRGDINDIKIGENTNIQDLSVLHVVEKLPLIVGSGVTVGHKVTLHACEVEDNCLIGMGAIILDGVKIGKGSVVAAGSVCPPGKQYPEHSLILGSPAKVVRKLTPEETSQYSNHFQNYIEAKDSFLNSCTKL